MKIPGFARAIWYDLTRRKPPQTVTISRFEGDEPDRRAIPMLTFTMDRDVDWSLFDRALRQAEQAFATGSAETASTILSAGVRIDAHPGFWTAPPEDRELDRTSLIEAFKIAKRQP